MGEFFRVIGEWMEFIWPLRKVDQWERGLLYRWGRYVRQLEPGIYIILPWFHDIRADSVVPAIVQTPRLDITAQDGTMVTFQASATVRVTDLNLAVNTVDAYTETMQELLAAVLAERMAKVDAARLAPEGRSRLLTDLARWVQEECNFGIEVSKLRFTTFVVNPRAFRLMGDNVTIAEW
jgi:regulator of protease activity HflC (stomatin/prohibitin superfamily)